METGIQRTAFEPGEYNAADILTKIFSPLFSNHAVIVFDNVQLADGYRTRRADHGYTFYVHIPVHQSNPHTRTRPTYVLSRTHWFSLYPTRVHCATPMEPIETDNTHVPANVYYFTYSHFCPDTLVIFRMLQFNSKAVNTLTPSLNFHILHRS